MEKGISRMKARFFRVRFSDNGKGIYHTLAYRDEIEKTCVHLSYDKVTFHWYLVSAEDGGRDFGSKADPRQGGRGSSA